MQGEDIKITFKFCYRSLEVGHSLSAVYQNNGIVLVG